MLSLAINIPNASDATSWYRGIGPLADIRSRCRFLNICAVQTWSWASLSMVDAVFMQRPFLTEHLQVMEEARFLKKKIWVDYDDYLLQVPTDNPTYGKYMTKEVQNNVRQALEVADVVTVSTEHLAELYKKFAKKIVVVPNAINHELFRRDVPKPRRKIVAWRGSPTHQRDVFGYAQQILETSRDPIYKDWQWHFIGDRMWFLTDSMPHYQTFVSKPMSISEYHVHLMNLCPAVVIVPLHDSDFNRCKSNIAWIEASYAGAVTIAPRWEEWNKPGVLLYDGPDDFKLAMHAVMSGKVNVQKTSDMSWRYIQENLTLNRVNDLRLGVLCDLLGCSMSDLGAHETKVTVAKNNEDKDRRSNRDGVPGGRGASVHPL